MFFHSFLPSFFPSLSSWRVVTWRHRSALPRLRHAVLVRTAEFMLTARFGCRWRELRMASMLRPAMHSLCDVAVNLCNACQRYHCFSSFFGLVFAHLNYRMVEISDHRRFVDLCIWLSNFVLVRMWSSNFFFSDSRALRRITKSLLCTWCVVIELSIGTSNFACLVINLVCRSINLSNYHNHSYIAIAISLYRITT